MITISPYVFAILAGWITAQGMKYVIASIRTKSLGSIRHIYLSGNMPSAHSATSVALLATVGLRDGTEGALFGIALLASLIAMYDAIMVRRSVGEQGLAIQEVILKSKLGIILPRSAKGHTPLEVAAGAILGLIVGVVVYLATT